MLGVYVARKLWLLKINQYPKSTLKLVDAKKYGFSKYI
jgi:hypothetical protein